MGRSIVTGSLVRWSRSSAYANDKIIRYEPEILCQDTSTFRNDEMAEGSSDIEVEEIVATSEQLL